MRVQGLCIDKSLSFCMFVMLFYCSVKEMRSEIPQKNPKIFSNVHPRRVHLDLMQLSMQPCAHKLLPNVVLQAPLISIF